MVFPPHVWEALLAHLRLASCPEHHRREGRLISLLDTPFAENCAWAQEVLKKDLSMNERMNE